MKIYKIKVEDEVKQFVEKPRGNEGSLCEGCDMKAEVCAVKGFKV